MTPALGILGVIFVVLGISFTAGYPMGGIMVAVLGLLMIVLAVVGL